MAEEAIRRAGDGVERIGNVYRPESFGDRRDTGQFAQAALIRPGRACIDADRQRRDDLKTKGGRNTWAAGRSVRRQPRQAASLRSDLQP